MFISSWTELFIERQICCVVCMLSQMKHIQAKDSGARSAGALLDAYSSSPFSQRLIMGVREDGYTGVYNTSHPEADQAENGHAACQKIAPQVD